MTLTASHPYVHQSLRVSVVAFALAALFAVLPLTTHAQGATLTRNLTLGMQGTDVTALQQLLKNSGHYTYPELTGYYGPATQAAVISFQKSKGIDPIGNVGPMTRTALLGTGGMVAGVSTDLAPIPTVARDPLYPSSVTGTDFDYITETDPNAFLGLEYVGFKSFEMPDKRNTGEPLFQNAYVFLATFTDGTKITIAEDKDFGSKEAAEQDATRYLTRLGKLPNLYRKNIKHVVVHMGGEDTTSFAEEKGHFFVIYSANATKRISTHDLEETFFHEGSHAAIQNSYSTTTAWQNAKAYDKNFITTYAKSNDGEDFAESALFAYTVIFHPERFPAEELAKIEQQIPNRIAFFRTIYAAPVSAPMDLCANIAGTQLTVPAGMERDSSGNCATPTPPSPPDLCPNIAGTQVTIPSGMIRDGSGNCVAPTPPPPTPTDMCNNISGVQITVPSDMVRDSSGNCAVPTPVDVCTNISGIQATVPSGMERDSSGNCATPAPIYLAPVGSPAPGSATSAQTVTLSASGANLKNIRYTINGDTPSCTSGTVYKNALSIKKTTTVKAIACYTKGSSQVVSLDYTIGTVATPTTQFPAPTSIPVAGKDPSPQTVSLRATNSKSIRYTLNGTTPSCTEGTLYKSAFSISKSVLVKAIACYTGGESPVADLNFVIR